MATQTATLTWTAATGNKTASFPAMTGTYGVNFGISLSVSIGDGAGAIAPDIVGTPTTTSAVISPGTDDTITATVVLQIFDLP